MKVVAIHQPNFLPWIGYFYKMMKSDVFVILDNVQFSKGSFTNRNKIKTPQGPKYITLPVITKNRNRQSILNCEISDKDKSVRSLINFVRNSYKDSKYFNSYFNDFKNILETDTKFLSEINISFIWWVVSVLDINIVIKRSSNMEGVSGSSTSRLISICKNLESNKYFSGFGGSKYQDEGMFRDEGIELVTTDFIHPVYFQLWGDFVPNLSILDLIFNHGSDSKKIILGNGES